MRALEPKNVLIAEPQVEQMGWPYLPIIWAILKTYWECNGTEPSAINWLPPIHRMQPAEELLARYDTQHVDVLGLSCYPWNSNLNMRLAASVKQRNPHCVVVAGGPDPNVNDPHLFLKHPYIDLVMDKDGEIPFTMLLETLISAREAGQSRKVPLQFSHIPGCYVPDANGRPRMTAPPIVPETFAHSPYIQQSAYYEALLKELRTEKVVAVWETNRGCPFSCSYCDWGSNTMSRVRKCDIERVRLEADWFGRMQIGSLMIADAKLGMLPRDIEIADMIIESNRLHHLPFSISYNTAKNNPERTLAIARRFLSSGLTSSHILSVQSTDIDVLKATSRANISVDKQIEVVRALLHDGVSIYAQLILGIPGDSYVTWKRSLTDLMEWGVHSHYWVYPYSVLPNAPSASAFFKATWSYETRSRFVLLNHGIRLPVPLDPMVDALDDILVSCKSFTQSDWIRMMTFSSIVRALHNCSLTQKIAIYLRSTHGVSYSEFYDGVIDELFVTSVATAELYRRLTEHYRKYLGTFDAADFLEIAQLPRYNFHMEPGRWMFVQVCMNIDSFFADLGTFLQAKYPAVAHLSSIMDYQQRVVIVPGYDCSEGKSFPTDYDWPAYFRLNHSTNEGMVPEPRGVPGAYVIVTDQACEDEGLKTSLNWTQTPGDNWKEWIEATVLGRNSALRNNHTQIQLAFR